MSFDILEDEVLLPIVAVVIEQLMTECMFENFVCSTVCADM